MLHHESIKFDFCSVKYILYTLGLQPYPQVVGPLKPTLTTFLGGSWSLGIYIYILYIYIFPSPVHPSYHYIKAPGVLNRWL